MVFNFLNTDFHFDVMLVASYYNSAAAGNIVFTKGISPYFLSDNFYTTLSCVRYAIARPSTAKLNTDGITSYFSRACSSVTYCCYFRKSVDGCRSQIFNLATMISPLSIFCAETSPMRKAACANISTFEMSPGA